MTSSTSDESSLVGLPTVIFTGCVTAVLLSALFVVQRESKKRYVAPRREKGCQNLRHTLGLGAELFPSLSIFVTIQKSNKFRTTASARGTQGAQQSDWQSGECPNGFVVVYTCVFPWQSPWLTVTLLTIIQPRNFRVVKLPFIMRHKRERPSPLLNN